MLLPSFSFPVLNGRPSKLHSVLFITESVGEGKRCTPAKLLIDLHFRVFDAFVCRIYFMDAFRAESSRNSTCVCMSSRTSISRDPEALPDSQRRLQVHH